jgi:hypothetical protein
MHVHTYTHIHTHRTVIGGRGGSCILSTHIHTYKHTFTHRSDALLVCARLFPDAYAEGLRDGLRGTTITEEIISINIHGGPAAAWRQGVRDGRGGAARRNSAILPLR